MDLDNHHKSTYFLAKNCMLIFFPHQFKHNVLGAQDNRLIKTVLFSTVLLCTHQVLVSQ